MKRAVLSILCVCLLAGCKDRKDLVLESTERVRERALAIANRSNDELRNPSPDPAPVHEANREDALAINSEADKVVRNVAPLIEPESAFSRNLKRIAIISVCVVILGLLIYFLPLRKWLVLLGGAAPRWAEDHVKLNTELLSAISDPTLKAKAELPIAAARASDPLLDAAWRRSIRQRKKQLKKKGLQ